MKKHWYLYLIFIGIAFICLIPSCVRLNSQQPSEQPLLGFRAYCDKAEFYYGQTDFERAYLYLDTALAQAEQQQDWLWVGRLSVRYVQTLGAMMSEKLLTMEEKQQKVALIQQKLANKQPEFPALEGYIITNKHLSGFNPDSAVINSARLLAIAEKEQEWGLAFGGNLAVARFLYGQKRFDELKKLAEAVNTIYTQHVAAENEPNTAFPSSDYSDYFNIMLLVDYANTDTEASEKTLHTLVKKLENYKYPVSINLFNAYNNLANVWQNKKDYRYSVELREKSLRMLEQKQNLSSSDSARLAAVMGSLASNYQQINEQKKALLFANKSISIYENLDYTGRGETFIQQCRGFLVDAYLSKIKTFAHNQQWENAEANVKIAKNYLKSIENTEDGEINKVQLYFVEIGLNLRQKKNEQALKVLKEFEKWLFRTKEVNPMHLFDYYESAAKTYAESAQPLKGLDFVQKQYALIQRESNSPTTVFFVPDFDSLADKSLAFHVAAQHLNCMSSLGRLDSSYWVNDTFVQSYWQTAKLCTRLFDYNLIHLNSEKSQAEFIQNLYATYDNAMEIGANLYQKTQDSSYLNQVWNWSEQTKSIFLLQTLYGETRQQFAGVPDSVVKEEQRLRRNLIYYEQQLNNTKKSDTAQYNRLKNTLFQIQTQQTEFNERIKAAYPKYHQLQYASPLAQIADVQKILSDSSQMLSFWVGNEYFYVFAISKQKAKLHKYSAVEAQNLLNELVPLYANPESDLNKLKNLSLQVYQNYLAPSIDSNKNELAIVADGLFNYLPFEALVASDFGKDAAREWDYLLQKYKISYHYSASLYQMLQTRESQASNWQILGMAADYKPQDNLYQQDSILSRRRSSSQKLMRKGLAPLKGAADEINKLPELYRGYFVVGETATEQEFVENAPYYGILHLAMHNVVDGDNPELSALVFTENGDTLNDNFLQSYEVKNLDLYADLVILSACETGFGKYQRGEGVVSVGRSFIYAGASSLLVSLWSLNDYTAPVITAKFYEYLQQGFSKTEALQRSKLDYLQTAKGNAAHPALWACLVQMGNTENISPSRRITIWWYLIPLGAVALAGLWARNALKQRRKF